MRSFKAPTIGVDPSLSAFLLLKGKHMYTVQNFEKAWVSEIFRAKALAKKGGVVRRSRRSVEKESSESEVIDAAKGRGLTVEITQDQYLFKR